MAPRRQNFNWKMLINSFLCRSENFLFGWCNSISLNFPFSLSCFFFKQSIRFHFGEMRFFFVFRKQTFLCSSHSRARATIYFDGETEWTHFALMWTYYIDVVAFIHWIFYDLDVYNHFVFFFWYDEKWFLKNRSRSLRLQILFDKQTLHAIKAIILVFQFDYIIKSSRI